MRLGIIALIIAAVTLLAACETTPEETAATSGQGATVGTGGAAGVESAPQPGEPAPGSVEEFVQRVGDRVFFDYDSAVLGEDARRALELQAQWLKRYPNYRIVVEGHCDERGTREYNLALGERRATSAKSYLVALGIDPNRIRTISYGKERPVALGHDEASWSQNRRAVTVPQ